MVSLLAGFGGSPRDDAVGAAQAIMYDAWGTGDRRRRIALAKKALKVSPLCADAYVLLAQETAGHLDEAIDMYRRGVEAGEKALGVAAFRENVGHFWGVLETRPYMRARHGLAQTLWAKGLHDEAVTHYWDLLRLNPNDNQGIRYVLMDCLVTLGRGDEAARLSKRYNDDASAAWNWSRALLAFRKGGDSPTSRRALARASRGNTHVAALLLGEMEMPHRIPDYIGMGDETEAVAYVHDGAAAWAATPGALAWVRALQLPK
jgi:tetratricopeptide (TPR) repeat protein